jgi:hypothetical protein
MPTGGVARQREPAIRLVRIDVFEEEDGGAGLFSASLTGCIRFAGLRFARIARALAHVGHQQRAPGAKSDSSHGGTAYWRQ